MLWLILIFGCVYKDPQPWLAAAQIYGEDKALSPLHGERSYPLYRVQIKHSAKSQLSHPRPEWWDWLPILRAFSDRPVLNESILAEDTEHLEQWFKDQGWLDAKVRSSLRNFGRKNGHVVDYWVNQGSRYRINSIKIGPLPLKSTVENFSLAPLKSMENTFYNASKLSVYSDEIRYELSKAGYPFAEVEFQIVRSSLGVDVTYLVNANQKCTFGPLEWGDPFLYPHHRLQKTISRHFHEGDVFNQETLDVLKYRLEHTPAFSSIHLKLDSVTPSNSVPVHLSIVEEERWKVEPFLNVASEVTTFEVGGGFRWTRSHVGMRNVSVSGSHKLGYRTFPFYSFPVELDLKNHGPVSDQGLNLWASIFPLRGLALSIQGQNQVGAEIGYQKIGTTVSSGIRLSQQDKSVLFTGVGYGLDYFYPFSDQQIVFEKWFGQSALLPHTERVYSQLEATVDLVDDIKDPKNGFQLRLDAQPYGSIENHPYSRVHNDMRVLGSTGPWTFVQRLGLGYMFWHKASVDSLSLRFFLGDGRSVRGWGRHRLEAPGYSGDLGDPRQGGDVMMETITEVRYALFPQWAFVTFVDSGRVWNGLSTVDLKQVLPSTGIGLQTPTPVGLATTSIGYQLQEENELLYPPSRWNFHFVISEAY